ncbi:MAG: GtrA family protein [Gammaproteobacteria bacterium]|nr:GtrA family protein [Gammaproteobacteria bacterium]
MGSLGFAVDASVLAVCVHLLGAGPVEGRVISVSCAVGVTWLLNRNFTFRMAPATSDQREFLRYSTVNVLGLTISVAVYLAVIGALDIAVRFPVIALVPASFAAAVFNYRGSLKFVFRGAG